MPNRETVRALVSAFNVHNYARNTVKTNFTLRSEGKKDYIVVSFDKSMDTYQCRRYLDSIKRKIIREFYGIEESNDAEILDTAKLIFDVNSFPFDISDRDWSWDKQHGFKFVTPIDQGVIFNLKSHLASSLKKDVLEDMRVSSTTIAFNKKKYLWHDEFDNKGLRKEFEREFLSRIKERYENVSKNPLKVEGNSVYIRNVFDDARFIDSVTRYITWLKGMGLQADSKVRNDVKAFKDLIIEFINQSTGLTVAGFVRNFPLDKEKAKILIPVVLDNGEPRVLASEEALKLNYAFNGAVLNGIDDKAQEELSVNGGSGIYGIDFSDPYISHCVITKIIESSVINKDHELSIDPERALSPAQSPFNSPIHAGPSGLRTPPEQTGDRFKGDRDSGIGESPPKPEDSVAHSPSGDPRSSFEEIQEPQSCFPRQVHHHVGAAESGSAWTSQPIGYWSSPAPSAGLWSLPQSGPSSWKGASERRTSDKPLTEEEKELFKALLYVFNLNNYIFGCPHTNCIVENGKIASLINDDVNVKEYLKELRNSTIEEYYHTEEKAKEACDLNEFPFKFLSNCEKNQETTVVANISRGALLNLKKLFIQEHKKKVEIKDIDINIVEKDVKSKKEEWVNSQVRECRLCPEAAIESCYPDESALEYISITKGKGGYWIDRNYDASEVKSFRRERWPAKGTSKVEKMKSKDNKDSAISSGEATDAENVSSKAEATTSSGYESMDCENTREGSPKRTLELSMGMEELAISTDLGATKAEQHSPIKKFRRN